MTDAAIQAMVDAIVAETGPEQVILFGSRGRGDHRDRSDVDLIVVEGEPFGPGRSRHREIMRVREAARKAVKGFGVGTDILVYSRDEVGYWRDSLNHVLARALREGKVVYGSGQGAAPASGSDLKAAREILERTRADLISLEESTPRVRDETFGFHVQQAAEKALKAWLALLGKKYPLTHELDQLLGRLDAAGASTGFFRPLTAFNRFAVAFRYHRLPEDHEPIDRPAAIILARALIRQVEDVMALQGGRADEDSATAST